MSMCIEREREKVVMQDMISALGHYTDRVDQTIRDTVLCALNSCLLHRYCV